MENKKIIKGLNFGCLRSKFNPQTKKFVKSIYYSRILIDKKKIKSSIKKASKFLKRKIKKKKKNYF